MALTRGFDCRDDINLRLSEKRYGRQVEWLINFGLYNEDGIFDYGGYVGTIVCSRAADSKLFLTLESFVGTLVDGDFFDVKKLLAVDIGTNGEKCSTSISLDEVKKQLDWLGLVDFTESIRSFDSEVS